MPTVIERTCPREFAVACRRFDVEPSRWLLTVNAARQRMQLFERIVDCSGGRKKADGAPPISNSTNCGSYHAPQVRKPAIQQTWKSAVRLHTYAWRREFLISTSRYGLGQEKGSNQTPLGLHRVARKVGGGYPTGTVFKSRQAIGLTWGGMPDAAIAHRILWLDGLEPDRNRGGTHDTFGRYVYIHGVGDELTLGRPASCGCVHLAAADLVPLFNLLPVGTLVWIGNR